MDTTNKAKERDIKNLWKRDSDDDHKGYITGKGCAIFDCGRVEEGEWLTGGRKEYER